MFKVYVKYQRPHCDLQQPQFLVKIAQLSSKVDVGLVNLVSYLGKNDQKFI